MHHLSAFCSADPFGPDAPLPLKQLLSIIERLTYAATCELFLPPAQITLRHLSSEDANAGQPLGISTFPSDSRSRAEIAGVILSRQLITLESIGHKDGAREAIRRILEDLLAVYDVGWAPVRRARVLVTALGVSWRDAEAPGLDVDRMGVEALELLRGVSLGLVRSNVNSLTCV